MYDYSLYLQIVGTFQIGSSSSEPKPYQKAFNSCIWLIGTARNAILVIVCGFIGYSFCLNGPPPFKVIGDVPQGLPLIQAPPFGYEQMINSTTGESITHTFFNMVADLGSGIIVVPLITLLESIAVCKAFGEFLSVYNRNYK